MELRRLTKDIELHFSINCNLILNIRSINQGVFNDIPL